jgi:hypothetical protein
MLLITGTDEDKILQIMINRLIGFCRRAYIIVKILNSIYIFFYLYTKLVCEKINICRTTQQKWKYIVDFCSGSPEEMLLTH